MKNIWKSGAIVVHEPSYVYSPIPNKITPYRASYVSETWKMTGKTTGRLNAFHQRCLSNIMTHEDYQQMLDRSPKNASLYGIFLGQLVQMNKKLQLFKYLDLEL